MSGLISDLMTASLARHSRSLTENQHFNAHPDLIVNGVYPDNRVSSGSKEYGLAIKSTKKLGGAVDTHGAREQWMCVFVWNADQATRPLRARRPTTFAEVYLAEVTVDDFRLNRRDPLGTRTATLHADGLKKLRQGWVYRDM